LDQRSSHGKKGSEAGKGGGKEEKLNEEVNMET
jgi:hypothetical protein